MVSETLILEDVPSTGSYHDLRWLWYDAGDYYDESQIEFLEYVVEAAALVQETTECNDFISFFNQNNIIY